MKQPMILFVNVLPVNDEPIDLFELLSDAITVATDEHIRQFRAQMKQSLDS